ncbi:hypothetical protein BN1013_01602 [Candidatus Rubidus massiliensis]|nr:hypothetical protein BN1013_01602 [Candidatus Rubidus massiliensis]
MLSFFKIFLIPICLFGWLFEDSRSPSVKAFENVLYQSAKLLEKKHNVSAMGSGGGIPEGVVKEFMLSFEVKGILTKEECRKLLIAMGTDFLNFVNSNQEVRPYLYKYPFEPKDICITLFFRDQNDNFVDYPYISVASYRYGDLTYKTQKYDREKDRIQTITEEQESVEDALKIVKGNQKT